jgi:ADP-ribosylglycohydrolase
MIFSSTAKSTTFAHMKQVAKISAEVVKNMLQGIAIGDAFGAGVEFQDRHWIRENVDFTHFVNARSSIRVAPDQLAAFVQDYLPWDYTDDTEMTIGLIKALVSGETFGAELLLRNIVAEYEDGKQRKGHGRNGHGSLRWYFDGDKTIAEILDFQRHRPNPGNAPAVRAVPLGLLPDHLINGFAEINAHATHPNILATLASQCIARASSWMIAQHGDADGLFQYCQDTIAFNHEYGDYLTQVAVLPTFESLTVADFATLCGPQPIEAPYFLPGICGVPSDSKFTAGCALYVLKHSRDAFDALQKSILIGGDVDSIAAITTGIMAARSGIQSIPDFMLQNVEGLPYLESIADKLVHHLQALQGN